jgi:demethylmenaquinone methyltransferase/2-methoxy-6-polyprenyl-1,4-benzoquinol methylase
VVPALGRLAGDPDAYTYLPSSVRRFPGPQELAERLVAAGLEDVRWVLTAGGIIAIHAGVRRAGS